MVSASMQGGAFRLRKAEVAARLLPEVDERRSLRRKRRSGKKQPQAG
jgi:hypothetical protein